MDTSTHVRINDASDGRELVRRRFAKTEDKMEKLRNLGAVAAALQLHRMFDVFTLFMQNKPNLEAAK